MRSRLRRCKMAKATDEALAPPQKIAIRPTQREGLSSGPHLSGGKWWSRGGRTPWSRTASRSRSRRPPARWRSRRRNAAVGAGARQRARDGRYCYPFGMCDRACPTAYADLPPRRQSARNLLIATTFSTCRPLRAYRGVWLWNSRKAKSPPSLSWGEERTKILLLLLPGKSRGRQSFLLGRAGGSLSG